MVWRKEAHHQNHFWHCGLVSPWTTRCADPLGHRPRSQTQAPLCTALNISAENIVPWFPRRWQVEVTFHEARTHLGMETQRQWAGFSILRITQALLSLFSMVTLPANAHARKDQVPIQQTAGYARKLPTFSDALRTVKQNLYPYLYFQTSPTRRDVRKSPPIHSRYHDSRSTRAFFQVSYGQSLAQRRLRNIYTSCLSIRMFIIAK